LSDAQFVVTSQLAHARRQLGRLAQVEVRAFAWGAVQGDQPSSRIRRQ